MKKIWTRKISCNTLSPVFIEQITPGILQEMLQKEKDLYLLDVRNPFEADICALEGSKLIPLHELMKRLDEIPRDKHIISICHHGQRSMMAAKYLVDNGFQKVFNLMGGIDAWAEQMDQEMARY